MISVIIGAIVVVCVVLVIRNNQKDADAFLVSMKKKADLNKDGVVDMKDAAIVVDAVKTTATNVKKKYGGKVKKGK